VRQGPLIRAATCAALAAGAIVVPRDAMAQWLRLTPGGGEVGVEARDERSVDGGRQAATNTFLSQWLNVPLGGVIFSPRLASYSLTIRPTWAQQTVFGQPKRFDTRAIGLGASATLLPSALVSLGLHADRMHSGTEGGPGSRTRYATRSGGGTVRYSNRAFPLVADWSARTTDDVWQAASDQAPVYRDETLHSRRLTGQSSKLRVSVERLRFEDRIGKLGFTSLGGTATHLASWGKGSSMQSMLETVDRDGHDRQRRRSLTERLVLQHFRTVATEILVDARRNVGVSDENRAFSGSAQVRLQPRPWFATGLKLSSLTTAVALGRVRTLAIDPNLRLDVKLPHGGRLASALSAGVARVKQQLPSGSWITVSDERHAVAESRVIALNRERGDWATVSIYNTERTIAYIAGLDYRVSTVGPLVRIDIPIASRIAVGDEVLISYRYETLASGDYDLHRADGALTLSLWGFVLSPSASLRRGRALDTVEPGGVDEGSVRQGNGDEFVLAAGYHRATAIGRIDVDVARRARERSTANFLSRELRGSVQPRPLGALQLAMGGSVARTATLNEAVRVVTSNVAVHWTPTPSLRVTTSRETWLWDPRVNSREEIVIWNSELGWTAGAIEAELKYVVQQRLATMDNWQRRLFGQFKRRF
jgi:hypothetical protein